VAGVLRDHRLFNPYAPLWFQALGMSTLAIGAIASLQSWTRLLAPYAWSWAADHSGARVALIRLAAAGCLLGALGLAAAPWLATTPAGQAAWLSAALIPAVIPALVALLFISNGGIVPLAEAALAQLLTGPNGLDATRYGRVRMWGSIGFIVAVLAGGALLQPLGIGVFPWLVVGINATLLVVAIRLPTGHEERHAGEPAPPVMPLLRQPAVAWFFGSVFFTVLAHTSLYAFLSLYLVHSGYGKQAVGALWAVSVAVEVLFFLLQGRWFHRLSPHGWLALAAGITALRFRRHGGSRCPAVGAGAGATDPCHHLCRPPCGLHRAGQPALSLAGCAVAARRCIRPWATACRACWAAWAVAG
jgi:PPP family 3-phenylpropionic acid transporter